MFQPTDPCSAVIVIDDIETAAQVGSWPRNVAAGERFDGEVVDNARRVEAGFL